MGVKYEGKSMNERMNELELRTTSKRPVRFFMGKYTVSER